MHKIIYAGYIPDYYNPCQSPVYGSSIVSVVCMTGVCVMFTATLHEIGTECRQVEAMIAMAKTTGESMVTFSAATG